MMFAQVVWAAAVGLLSTTATEGAARATPVALAGARIHTAAGPAVKNCTIVFQDGVIAALGADPSPPGRCRGGWT